MRAWDRGRTHGSPAPPTAIPHRSSRRDPALRAPPSISSETSCPDGRLARHNFNLPASVTPRELLRRWHPNPGSASGVASKRDPRRAWCELSSDATPSRSRLSKATVIPALQIGGRAVGRTRHVGALAGDPDFLPVLAVSAGLPRRPGKRSPRHICEVASFGVPGQQFIEPQRKMCLAAKLRITPRLRPSINACSTMSREVDSAAARSAMLRSGRVTANPCWSSTSFLLRSERCSTSTFGVLAVRRNAAGTVMWSLVGFRSESSWMLSAVSCE